MADSPKTLADVKALLEQAVQVVNDLQAPSTEENTDQAPTDNQPQEAAPTA